MVDLVMTHLYITIDIHTVVAERETRVPYFENAVTLQK